MGLEIKQVTRMEAGFGWHISIERELQRAPGYFSGVETVSRSSDKETIHASLEGHHETYDGALADLQQARDNLKGVLDEFTRGKVEKEEEKK